MQLLLIAVFTTLTGGPRHSIQLTPPDSTYLTFTLEKGAITVRLLHWSKRATTASELNHFVDAHLPGIDPEKIILIGDPKAKYKEFAPIIEVLKKHDWMKFKLQNK
jgi:biopolymer transport protein ExbD